MVRFRRQPTKEAILGVIIFTSYSLHQAHRNELSTSTLAPLLLVIALISSFFLFVEPIAQPQAYHNFADKRLFLCSCHGMTEGFFLPDNPIESRQRRRRGFLVPNFGDVASNIVILAGGIFGVIMLQFDKPDEIAVHEESRQWELQVCLPVFFYATVLISFGSTYYHWKPNDASLVWDRLPMTLAFVSIFCYMLEEYLPTAGIGQSSMLPLLVLGVGSVLYWKYYDDLRLYAMVQFLPLVIIAVLLSCCEPRHGGAAHQAVALVCYAIAKVCEERDYEIFHATNQRISGHSLKHIIAGLASVSVASMLLS